MKMSIFFSRSRLRIGSKSGMTSTRKKWDRSKVPNRNWQGDSVIKVSGEKYEREKLVEMWNATTLKKENW